MGCQSRRIVRAAVGEAIRDWTENRTSVKATKWRGVMTRFRARMLIMARDSLAHKSANVRITGIIQVAASHHGGPRGGCRTGGIACTTLK